jgi:hypothetical protein
MWLWLVGALAFGTCYGIYAQFLGWVDGLPALPTALLDVRPVGDDVPLPIAAPLQPAAIMLKQAFGENCRESDYPIQVYVKAKGIVLAAREFKPEKADGRVRLTPFSLALFGKKVGESLPDIYSVHCDTAYLTFDKRIERETDIANARIIGVELVSDLNLPDEDERKGLIHITHNRKTPSTDDDLYVRTPGPLLYRETPVGAPDDTPNIWTGAAIECFDRQSEPRGLNGQPKQTPIPTIVAQGLNVYLLSDAPAKGANKPTAINGVRRIDLLSAVVMNLWVDSNSGFLGSPKPSETKPAVVLVGPPAPTPPAEKTRVQIKTRGPFHYDVQADKAKFEIEPNPDPHLPSAVEVCRSNKENTNDVLTCDYLEIQFQRKAAKGSDKPAKAGGNADMADLEIQTAHAWGKQIALSSDSENLSAFGTDLVYDATLQQTVLQGEPNGMQALKDGHEIYARKLQLNGLNSKGQQTAIAWGPGILRMNERGSAKPGERTPPREATWNEQLTFTKDDGVDLLTLTGGATFVDTAADQRLQARTLKLWLADGKAAAKTGANTGLGSRRPQRLLAQGQVVAHSPDLDVHDCEQLNVFFIEAPVPKMVAAPAPAPTAVAHATAPVPLAASAPTTQAAPVAPPPPPPVKKPPIDLRARTVETVVLRKGTENELDEVHCAGGVRVHQDPAPGEPRGIDITGATLHIKHYPEGNVMDVLGHPNRLAEIVLPKLALLGPDVQVDQRANTARVKGGGSMRLPSATDLNGVPLAKPTEMTIHWLREMQFVGDYAVFVGGVQAEQLGRRVQTPRMTVKLDRVVKLNPANDKAKPDAKPTAKEEPAKVDRVECDTDGQREVRVLIEDGERGPLGAWTKFQRIVALTTVLDNLDNRLDASGPGEVRLLQMGRKDGTLSPAPASPTSAPAEQEMKLTRVRFRGKMMADNKQRTASFIEEVEVVYLPSDNPDLVIDLDRLPPTAFTLRCKQMDLYTRQIDPQKAVRLMEAKGRATASARTFQGDADVIKFNEETDTIIFEGTDASPATLYRSKIVGGAAEVIRGTKIFYNLRDGSYKGEKIQLIQAQP